MNAKIITFWLALFISQNLSAANSCSTTTPEKSLQAKTTFFSQLLKNGSLFNNGTLKRQANNYIFPKAAHKLVANRAAFLIDLRSQKDYQRLRIPSSLNIPSHNLKTKNFLKNKHIILFNEGHSYLLLESLYFSLKKAGFKKISILEGGLNQWNKQIGNLIGDLHNLNKITLAQFFPERNYKHWQVIDISQITKIINKKPESYILITSKQGKNYPKIQAKLQHLNIFYLQGGVQAYRQFLQQQHNQRRSAR